MRGLLQAAGRLALVLASSWTCLGIAATSPVAQGSGDPDPALAAVVRDIEDGRLDTALKKVDALIERFPNFRLAHLIRGDLLLARTRPIAAFGNLSGAPADKLSDLRDEAIVRLKAYRNRPPNNYVPRYLLQMEQEQKYAIVVDTQRSRLYIYQNDGGRPRFVADYYIAHGKLGAEKTREGDKRTPIGVYHVTANLPRQKLSDFYGSGAFPISYPNEWDRQQGRNGHGIWLHGTPSDTYSRPPRASDGCVVLTNQDFDAIAGYMQIGLTPVIISNTIEWLSLEDWTSERTALSRQIEAWRKDWESRDVDRYLSHYSKSFRNNDGDLEQWARQKRLVSSGKTWVKIALDKMSVFRNPGKQDMIVVTFEQDYRSNNLSNVLRKRQYWMKEGGQWKIIYEGFA
ncbi:L,D-transpeptidase family protein [Zoogloea sp.]|uniref:L,D-transpeptidase family protein n=1 Tax=Zoogloea sp. TaxID=49181 RepID=UPI0014166BA4|nr:MAG: L,D-transpeptidase family protein [Zoogloea sp.]